MSRLDPSTLVRFGVMVVVVGIVVAGLVAIGPPSANRMRRFDERRAADLRSIQRAVDVYWTRHDRLPRSLDELASEPGIGPVLRTTDPGTGEAYGFRPMGDPQYELCTVFESAGSPTSGIRPDPFWSHDAGRQCFGLDAESVRP